MTTLQAKSDALHDDINSSIFSERASNKFLQQELEKRYKNVVKDRDSKQETADKTLLGGGNLLIAIQYLHVLTTLKMSDDGISNFVEDGEPFDDAKDKIDPKYKAKYNARFNILIHFAKFHLRNESGAEIPVAMFKRYLNLTTKKDISLSTVDNILSVLARMDLIKFIASPQGHGSQAIIVSEELLSLVAKREMIKKGMKDA